MKQLLEDYQRRLKTITKDIKDLENIMGKESMSNFYDEYIRLKTKASCYRTFIAELEKELTK